MKRICKVLLVLVTMLITLTSCKRREDEVINDNMTNQVIEEASDRLNQEENNQPEQSFELTFKSITQEEYDTWVVPGYDGYYDQKGQLYQLPELEDFDYPYVEGMEDKELQKKVNETIKVAIFNEEFFSGPMSGVVVGTTPWSEFKFPGIISNKEVLSIPIVLYWNREKSYYKSISVTIDLKTGERLFLEDIIKLNEDFAYKLIYEEGFFVNIDIGGIEMKEFLYSRYAEDGKSQSEASMNLLDDLRGYVEEDEKPNIEEFYLTEDGLVLTSFANSGVPREINIPLKNLHEKSRANTLEKTDEENCENNEKSYKIIGNSYNEKEVTIDFPYIDGISDINKQNKINEIIKDEAFVVFNDFYEGEADDLSLEINYTVTWESKNLLSIQYYGYAFSEGAAYPLDLLYTVNLDINEGCKLKLKDIINIDKSFVNKYKNYEIANPDKNQIEVGAFNYILDSHSTDDLLRCFSGADTSFNESDYVFSYFKDDALGISINVPYVAGNHLEIELKYQDIKDNINYENEIWKDLVP